MYINDEEYQQQHWPPIQYQLNGNPCTLYDEENLAKLNKDLNISLIEILEYYLIKKTNTNMNQRHNISLINNLAYLQQFNQVCMLVRKFFSNIKQRYNISFVEIPAMSEGLNSTYVYYYLMSLSVNLSWWLCVCLSVRLSVWLPAGPSHLFPCLWLSLSIY